MKKLLLPLLLLVLFSMLAAVETNASAVVGYVKYPCYTGINLIALPMDVPVGYTCGDFADNYPGMISELDYWDAVNQQWIAAVDWGYWEGNFDVYPGLPMMITANDDFDAYSLGALPAVNASYALEPGINLMMIPLDKSDINPLNNPDMTADLSDAIGAGVLSEIDDWDALNQQWIAAVDWGYWEGDFAIHIAMPLMVTANEQATWPTRSRNDNTLHKSSLSKSKK